MVGYLLLLLLLLTSSSLFSSFSSFSLFSSSSSSLFSSFSLFSLFSSFSFSSFLFFLFFKFFLRHRLRHPELKVSTPAHTKHLGCYVEFEFRVTQCVLHPISGFGWRCPDTIWVPQGRAMAGSVGRPSSAAEGASFGRPVHGTPARQAASKPC